MDNIINPARQLGSFTHGGSRWARLWIAVVAAGLFAGVARAQTSYSISTLAGQPNSPGAVDALLGPDARFRDPAAVVADAAGNLYVADTANHAVRKVVVSTGAVSTVAGLMGTSGSADGDGSVARFNNPQGLALDAANNKLYVADTSNHTIRVINLALATPVVSTLAGAAGTSGSTDNLNGTLARFNVPVGLAVSGAHLYVADSTNHSIRKIVIATGAVTTLAGPDGSVGNTAGTSGFVDSATPASARFFSPTGLAADSTNLYVADKVNNRIRKVVLATGVVSTLAGAATSGSADGTGTAATFSGPEGLAINAAGTTLLVADTLNQTLRRVTIATGEVTTPAGVAAAAPGSFADGIGSVARFALPKGVAFDSSSNVYVADLGNQLIRRGAATVAPAITSANNATFTVGTAGSFPFVATGSPTPTFSLVSGALPAGVTLSPAGVLSGTPTAATGSPFSFTVQASNGVGTAATQAFTLTVNQPPVITSAATTTFAVGVPATFQVVATGSPAPTFSITAGTLSGGAAFMNAAGLITAAPPTSTAGSPFTFTITATNSAGSTTQSFTLNVTTGPTISTAPAAANVAPGASAQFSVVAAVNGGGALTYVWERRAAGSATFVPLTEGGRYTGTATPILTVASASLADSGDRFRVVVSSTTGSPATSTDALLTITQAPAFTSLAAATFVENQAGTFTVQATGSPATITYTLTSGTLPTGITLNSTTGVLSGTPAAATSALSPYSLVITASNGVSPNAVQSLQLVVSPAPQAPLFTTQPVNASFTPGQITSFSVVASGIPAPTIKWQRQAAGQPLWADLVNDANYNGVTTSTLTLLNPTSGMNGDAFRAVATNASAPAGVTSQPATLSIGVGTVIASYAGQVGTTGGVDGIGPGARFNAPTGMATDSSGNLYIADTNNHVIRKIAPGGIVTTVAGQAGVSGSADGVGAAARFNAPSAVAVSSTGTLFVADTYNHTIRAIAPNGTVSTLAGLAGSFGSDNGTGTAARFLYPYGVAVDSSGTVYVADTFNHAIRRVSSTGVVTLYAGVVGVRGTADGSFAFPFALVVDAAGNLFVADAFNHAIRKIDTVGTVTTLAGAPGTSGTADGTGAAARFNQPSALVLETGGSLLVADTLNHTLRRVSSTGVVTTLAGSPGVSGSADGFGSAVRFNQPFGVAVDASGTFYVSDTRNQVIRRSGTVGAPTITTQPVATATGVGGSATFTVTASGTPAPSGYTWYRLPAGGASFVPLLVDDAIYSGVRTNTLRITGATAAMSGDRFQVVVSNLVNPNAASNSVALTVGTGPTITTQPVAATAAVGGSASFSVAATGSPAPSVFTWYRQAAGSATFTPLLADDATYTGVRTSTLTVNGATAAMTGDQFQVVVSNLVVPDATSTAVALTVGTVPTITTQPLAATAAVGGTATFSVAASGSPAPSVFTWYRQAAGSATFTPLLADDATYTGVRTSTLTVTGATTAMTGDQFQVVVSNLLNSGATSTPAALTVGAAPTITAQPVGTMAMVGGSASFTVAANGSPAPTVFTWYRQAAGSATFTPLLTDDATYSGVRTATLRLAGALPAMSGDQFRVVVSNGINPEATSNPATLTVGIAPTFTSATTATFRAGSPGVFTFAASGDPTPAFSVAGLPSWASFNSRSGVLSGTPPDTTGSPLTLTVTASNPLIATQTFVLTITPAVLPPSIATQPQAAVLDLGGTLALSVTASGTEPFTYQWSRDGVPLTGATSATLNLTGVQASAAGRYTVRVTNSLGSVTSAPANVVVTTLPVITQQPQPQVTSTGASASFTVSATGGASFNYQWRRNGVSIAGATGASLTVSNVSAGDAGIYDVLVANVRGTTTSSAATLRVVNAQQAPVISAQPASQVVPAGGVATLTVGVSAAPSPTFQWRRSGEAIAGATSAGYLATESGSYDVVITNSAGSVTSRAAAVRVLTQGYAGTYFGNFSDDAGTFALLVRPDNTAVFLAYAGSAPLMNLNFNVTDSGAFAFSQSSFGQLQAVVNVSGTIGTDGTVTGSTSGAFARSFVATRATDVGPTQGVAGFYQSGANIGAAVTYLIAGPTGQAYAVVQSGSASDGGLGTVAAAGQVNVLTNRSVISATINAATGLVTGNSTGLITANYAGGSEVAIAAQRLVNISSRARVSPGEGVAIAGFVISGDSAKTVLIRAVGPTLNSVFGLAGALASPRLELRASDQTSLAVNAGIAGDRAAIDAASKRAGAFELGSSGADAAILTTLAPGAYTAAVRSTNDSSGIALIEVYDLTGVTPGQKLLNISTRASAGTGDNTLIAGFVVPPGAAKRVLVRGVGPGLTSFGVQGVLAQPTIEVINNGVPVAQNTNWATSPYRDSIATASLAVGAFTLSTGDSALILTLGPGEYTAKVTGSGAAAGVALVEVYELP